MALEIPQSDRIYNQEPLPEGFNPDDPRQVNADWIMRMFDKIVNGEYAMKSFKTYSNFTDLPNTAEQGETAYVEEDAYKNNIFIYNGSSWIMAGGGGSITVDSSLSTVSTNPVQNKVITKRINDVAAAIPIVDTTLSPTSTNTIQNKVVTEAIQEILPSQEDNEGRFLTTDGEEPFWADINEGLINLFDIKTITEPETQRNWCCISDNEQKKLSRDEVSEAYSFIQDKLNDCDKEIGIFSTIKQSTTVSNSFKCYKAGNSYVVFNEDNKLYQAEDINDSSSWTKINDYEINPNNVIFIEGEVSCYNDKDNNIIIINNEDLSIIKVLASTVGIIPQFEFDGYFYGLANGDTYRWKDSLDANEIEIEIVVAEFSFLSQTNNRLDKIYTVIDDYYYFNVYSLSGNVVCGCRAKDLSQPDNYEIMGYWNKAFVDYDFWKHRFLIYDNGLLTATTEETIINGEYSGHDVFEFTETSVFDNIDNIDLTEFTSLSVSNSNWSIYSSHWGVYILEFTNNNGTQKLFLRTDNNFENFTKLFDGTYNDSDGVSSVLYDENLLVVSDYMPSDDISILGRLRIADAERVEYTDTINGISIKYYKNGNWKICTAGQNNRAGGDTTDGKLQDVYDYLGYLNYWWVDEENEQFSLQRNSNLWTMMFVGNDYKDDELPSGEYKPFALKGESSSGVSAAIVSANGLAPSAFGSGYVGGIDKYLTINSLIKTQDYSSWEIELIYTHGYNNNSLNAVVAQCENDKSGLTLNIDNNAQLLINILQDANTWLVADAYVNLTVVKGTTYYIKISYSNNSYSLEYKTNPSDNYTQIWTYSGANNYQVDKFCLIGTALPGNSQYRANASLLQDFKFVGDNNTIFQLSTAIEGTDFINTDCGYVDNKEVYFT